MTSRPVLFGTGLLLLALLVYVIATTAGKTPPGGELEGFGPRGADPGPGLRAASPARKKPSRVPAQPSAPTADEWLRAWDPADGIPMGDDTLRGVVVDPAGGPIFGARLYLRAKEGEPPIVDQPSTWRTRSDADGRWQLGMAYAARSLLCAWAPGYERAHVDVLDPETEIRVVLERSPEITVTVKAPPQKPGFLDEGPLEDAYLRVRLVPDGAREHPRPGEPLRAEWNHLIETDTPTPLRLPRDVPAYLTASADDLASDPPWVTLPNAAKDIVLQLVPSASIRIRLVDAETKEPLPLPLEGESFWELTHAGSGFELPLSWSNQEALLFRRGVSPGTYHIRASYRGYLAPDQPPPIVVREPGQRIEVDIPLARDRQRGTLHVILQHAEDSQYADQRVEAGLTLARRREDDPATWRYGAGMSTHLQDGRMRRTLEDLPAGTYDVLVWSGSSFPPVGHLIGIKVQGGGDATHEITLREGYGFRPSDVLPGALGDPRRLRVQCKELGALPWIGYGSSLQLFEMDDLGFARVTGAGYIGSYPSEIVTLVEQPGNGKARTVELKASISPPR